MVTGFLSLSLLYFSLIVLFCLHILLLKNFIFLSLSFCCFFARSNFFIIVALLLYDDYNDVITIDRIDIDIHATLMRNSILETSCYYLKLDMRFLFLLCLLSRLEKKERFFKVINIDKLLKCSNESKKTISKI